jgi:hypothetical protein
VWFGDSVGEWSEFFASCAFVAQHKAFPRLGRAEKMRFHENISEPENYPHDVIAVARRDDLD